MGYVVDLNNPSVKAAVGKFMSSVQQRLKEANDPEVQKRKAYDLAIEKLDKKDLVDYYGTVSYGSIDDKNYFNIRSKGNVDVDNQGQNLQSLVGMIE